MDKKYEPIIEAAKKGGKVLKKYFGEVLEIEEKLMVGDFRTKADQESEEIILQILEQHYPDYNFLGEETGFHDKNSEYTFIVDPLDGTNNFSLGIPHFSVTISLLKNNEVIFAVIHHPIINRTYHAQKGDGAYLDNKQIKISNESDIKKATITYTCSYKLSVENCTKSFLNNLTFDTGIKRAMNNWCPTLDFCMLASGKIEAIVNNDCEIYDFIGGKFIAMEAGAKVTSLEGGLEENDKNSKFIISNGTVIHDNLLDIVKRTEVSG